MLAGGNYTGHRQPQPGAGWPEARLDAFVLRTRRPCFWGHLGLKGFTVCHANFEVERLVELAAFPRDKLVDVGDRVQPRLGLVEVFDLAVGLWVAHTDST